MSAKLMHTQYVVVYKYQLIADAMVYKRHTHMKTNIVKQMHTKILWQK